MPSTYKGPLIRLSAVLTKAEMGSTAEWIDYNNATPVECNGAVYAPGSLRCLGFFGVFHGADRLFYGHYRFAILPTAEQGTEDCALIDVQALPGLASTSKPEPLVTDDGPLDGEESE